MLLIQGAEEIPESIKQQLDREPWKVEDIINIFVELELRALSISSIESKPSVVKRLYRQYLIFINDGIQNKNLHIVDKPKFPIDKGMAVRAVFPTIAAFSGPLAFIATYIITLGFAAYSKMSKAEKELLNNHLMLSEVIQHAICEEILVLSSESDVLNVENPMEWLKKTGTGIDANSIVFTEEKLKEYVTLIYKEHGSKKGKKEKEINDRFKLQVGLLVDDELKDGCKCNHADVAKRLEESATSIAMNVYGEKYKDIQGKMEILTSSSFHKYSYILSETQIEFFPAEWHRCLVDFSNPFEYPLLQFLLGSYADMAQERSRHL